MQLTQKILYYFLYMSVLFYFIHIFMWNTFLFVKHNVKNLTLVISCTSWKSFVHT